MSRLFGAARRASEYIRRRTSRATRAADAQISQTASSAYVRNRRSLARRLADFIFGRNRDEPPPPPPEQPQEPQRPDQPDQPQPPPTPPKQPPTPPPPPPKPRTTGGFDDDDGYGKELGYGDIKLLGRDASYDPEDWKVVMDQMRRTPGSSNVYGYYFEFESRTHGILYVTFLANYRGVTTEGPGPTYAYYGVTARKYHEFARATDDSAGGAVWDYLRVRGSTWEHQHNYRLIQVTGDYIPRKVTRRGFRTRYLPPSPTSSAWEYRRSTLEEQIFPSGEPDRGEPDRGRG